MSEDANIIQRAIWRMEEAERQIADARAEPTSEEVQAQDPELPELATTVLVGPRRDAYLRLEAAAKAAQAAQEAIGATGQELRDAIGEMCKVVAG